MRNTVAVMNTKGGVGKSTIVLGLAETLSAFHSKNVLVIDSDAQASVSTMLMTTQDLAKVQAEGLTMVEFLVTSVLNEGPVDWPKFVVREVSDVDEARSVYLMPSDMELTLFEREVSKVNQHSRLRTVIGDLLGQVRPIFDIILIDCPPGLSVLTESWLREADFYIAPTKPDYASVCGLDVFRRFKDLNPEMGFAQNLGLVVNMKDKTSPTDDEYHRWLEQNDENRCFASAIPRMNALQDATRYQAQERSYAAKFPGEAGSSMRKLAQELLARVAEANADASRTAAPAAS
jgi:chromosome partitioning protein